MSKAIALRVTHLLPKLEAEDFAALPKAHQRQFFRFINPKYFGYGSIDMPTRRELARALLLAVTRLGQDDALLVTKNVAAAKLKSGEDDTLQRTAQNCLPLLEKARADNATEQRMVLRR